MKKRCIPLTLNQPFISGFSCPEISFIIKDLQILLSNLTFKIYHKGNRMNPHGLLNTSKPSFKPGFFVKNVSKHFFILARGSRRKRSYIFIQMVHNRLSILHHFRKIRVRQPHWLEVKGPSSCTWRGTLKTKKDQAVIQMESRKMLDRGFRAASPPGLIGKTSIKPNLDKIGQLPFNSPSEFLALKPKVNHVTGIQTIHKLLSFIHTNRLTSQLILTR